MSEGNWVDKVEEFHKSDEASEEPVVEETPAAEPVAEETPAAEPVVEETPAEPAAEETPAEPEWTPDYKFKVLDQEHEIPDYIRPVITKDNHGEVKEIFEKAYGLSHVKERAAKHSEELERLRPVEEKYSKLNENWDYLNGLVQKGDMRTFAETLKLPKQDVLKYALELIEYDNLPPEQKVEYDSRRESDHRLSDLERENQSLRNMGIQNQVQARTQQVNRILERDNIKGIVQDFDARMGEGEFLQEVINHGAMVEARTKNNPNGPTILTIDDAVNQVLKKYGSPVQAAGTQEQDTTTSDAAPSPVSTKAKPVIPNISAGHKSPAKKVISSLSELREIQQQKAAEARGGF